MELFASAMEVKKPLNVTIDNGWSFFFNKKQVSFINWPLHDESHLIYNILDEDLDNQEARAIPLRGSL